MAYSYHEVETHALSLKPDERAHLLEKLIESFEPATKIESAWIAEALRRRQDVQDGKVKLIPGDEVLAQLRDRLV
jgi:putative addiction module component (TIGR02574 family)